MTRPASFSPGSLAEHALLDSGDGRKLERFGSVVLDRPDPQALWARRLPSLWDGADLRFERESDRGGRWVPRQRPPQEWEMAVGAARLLIRPTPFKHVGLFPEQASNWSLLTEHAEPGATLLNLFGYTGAASVLAVAAGWSVTHVDASKQSLDWATENLRRSGLGTDGMRVLCEDALRFAQREVRRGRSYDAVFLDPPHYGRGPRGEVWRLEEGLPALVDAAVQLLRPGGVLVLSTYAVGHSPLTLLGLLEAHAVAGDRVEAGELALPEQKLDGHRARLLPAGFCARLHRAEGA